MLLCGRWWGSKRSKMVTKNWIKKSEAATVPALLCSALKGITVLWCKRGTRSCPQQPPTSTHTHIPLFSASSLFLPKPTRPLRPQGQLVWHGNPSPPHLHLFIFSSLTSTQKKQSLTYLAPYLFPSQLMSQPLTSSWCRNNSNKKTSP